MDIKRLRGREIKPFNGVEVRKYKIQMLSQDRTSPMETRGGRYEVIFSISAVLQGAGAGEVWARA